jgi:hypothetical protein
VPADQLIAEIPEGEDRAQKIADALRARVARLAGKETDGSKDMAEIRDLGGGRG